MLGVRPSTVRVLLLAAGRPHHPVGRRTCLRRNDPSSTPADRSPRPTSRSKTCATGATVTARRIAGGIVGVGVSLAVVVAAAVSIGSMNDAGTAIPRDGGAGPAAPRPPVAIGPGDYSYQRVQMFSACGTDAGGEMTLCPDPRVDFETWWKADGSGRIAVIAKQDYGIDAGVFGPGEFPTEGDLTGFPLDPDELRTFLLARSDSGGPSPGAAPTPLAPGVPLEEGVLWNAISEFLAGQYPNTTPALRASMLDVLASLSMVTRDDHATDPLGRDAIALRFVAAGGHVTVYMDPTSHDFLGAPRCIRARTRAARSWCGWPAQPARSMTDPPATIDW